MAGTVKPSARAYDEDQRLHIRNNTISKANVCIYYGREIPGAEELGLNPNHPYRLLRDPDELRAGAATFNNLPLLSEHVHVSAQSPRNDLIIGSSGTDANFDGEFLRVSLVVWVADYIARIENNSQKELSSCYRYVPVMQPGEYNGEPYDGRMTQIRGNHIALVVAGRAGPTVVVGDSRPTKRIYGVLDLKEPAMSTKKRLYMSAFGMLAEQHLKAFIAPRLAADQKVDLAPVVKAMGSAKQYPSNMEKVAAALRTAIKDKLAADADVADVQEVLSQIAEMAPEVADLVIGGPEAVMANAAANNPDAVVAGGDPTDPTNSAPAAPDGVDPANATAAKPDAISNDPPSNVTKTDGDNPPADKPDTAPVTEPAERNEPGEADPTAVSQFLDYIKNNQLNDEEIAAVKAALEGIMAGSADTVTKTAMDSAVTTAAEKARRDAIATFGQIRAAEAFVAPMVGTIPPTVALDSAEAVYRHALTQLGHDVKNVHGSALLPMLKIAAQAQQGRNNLPDPAVFTAQDSEGYSQRFGEAGKRLK